MRVLADNLIRPSSRVLVFSRAVPYKHIDHAGGVYVSKVVTQLAASAHHVKLIAPGTSRNIAAVKAGGVHLPVRLAGREDGPAGPLWRLGRRLAWGIDPSTPDLGILVLLLTSPRLRKEVRNADVIDLQWADNARLAQLIRRISPSGTVIATFHDVSSQSYDRHAQSASGRLDAIRWKWAAFQSRRSERTIHTVADRVLVLSQKDAELLPLSNDRLAVVDPPLFDDSSGAGSNEHTLRAERLSVIFVGAMKRAENDDAARWLLDNIWPRVLQGAPHAHLRIVGGNPSEALKRIAASATNVEVTGFVERLDSYYQAADVAIVPLRFGAGVKFKTIDALVHQVPVVTTTLGAEGIDPISLFWAVDDQPQALADAVVDALARGPEAHDHAVRAGELCRERYGIRRFAKRINELY